MQLGGGRREASADVSGCGGMPGAGGCGCPSSARSSLTAWGLLAALLQKWLCLLAKCVGRRAVLRLRALAGQK